MHIYYHTDPPVVTALSTNQEVNLTQALSLSCSAHAYPPITNYKWTKDGLPIQNNKNELEISYVDVS